MKNIRIRTLSLLLAASFAAPIATAHDYDRKAVNGEMVAEALRESGYDADLSVDGAGDPLIATKMDETRMSVVFHNCNDEGYCEDLQFLASFTMDDDVAADTIETWNREKLHGKAYLDTDGDPTVEIVVQVGPGGTPELLEGYFSTVEFVTNQFREHIGFE